MDQPIVFTDKKGKSHTLNSDVYFKVSMFRGKDHCIMMCSDKPGTHWELRFIRPKIWAKIKPKLTFLFIDRHTYYKYIQA